MRGAFAASPLAPPCAFATEPTTPSPLPSSPETPRMRTQYNIHATPTPTTPPPLLCALPRAAAPRFHPHAVPCCFAKTYRQPPPGARPHRLCFRHTLGATLSFSAVGPLSGPASSPPSICLLSILLRLYCFCVPLLLLLSSVFLFHSHRLPQHISCAIPLCPLTSQRLLLRQAATASVGAVTSARYCLRRRQSLSFSWTFEGALRFSSCRARRECFCLFLFALRHFFGIIVTLLLLPSFFLVRFLFCRRASCRRAVVRKQMRAAVPVMPVVPVTPTARVCEQPSTRAQWRSMPPPHICE